MITVSGFVQELKILFPSVTFYNGAINRNQTECIGVYANGSASPYKALGGAGNTSYNTLPIRILVHWTQNADTCELMANSVYEKLFQSDSLTIGGKRVIEIDLLDSSPKDISRDENNICEMVVRLNLIYER